MMALCDMLWCKGKQSDYAFARMATLTSRHRDCGGLNDLTFAHELRRLDISELALWIWNPDLAKDFQRLIKSGNEIGKEDSYMPCFMDLQLSDRSPYSITLNIRFHYWIHVIGCTLAIERSRNARKVGIFNHFSLTHLGGLLGFAILNTTGAIEQVSESEETGFAVEEADTSNLTNAEKERKKKKEVLRKSRIKPKTLVASDWYNWFLHIERTYRRRRVKH